MTNDGSAVLLSLYSNAIVSLKLCGCAFQSNPPLPLLASHPKDPKAMAVTSPTEEVSPAVTGEVNTSAVKSYDSYAIFVGKEFKRELKSWDNQSVAYLCQQQPL